MSLPKTLLLIITTILPTLAHPTTLTPRNETCYTGVYMIAARASGQAPGEGFDGPIASSIQSQIPDSASIPLVYPATIKNEVNYEMSLGKGVRAMKAAIEEYVDRCGEASDIVLLGYSQGAQVISCTLAGNAPFEVGNVTVVGEPGLAYKYSQYVKGAVLMGDPAWTANQTFDRGNATTSGIFARYGRSLKQLNEYASIIRSWCDEGDPFCASGHNSSQFINHVEYVEKYGTDAINFIVDLHNAGK